MKLSINTKRLSQLFIMTIVGASIALIMSYTLLIRQGRENISFYETFNGLYTLFDQAIVYFIGPFRTLDYSLQHYVNNKYFWGRLTFGGIEQLISFVLLPLNLETAYESITPLIQTPIVIGYNDRTFNAFYTSIINHYLDFRIPGVAVFSYAHGYIVRKAFDYYDSNKNIMVLCLLTYRSLMTVLLWGYQTSNAWVAVIIMLMISREKTVTLNDEIPN